MRRRFLFEADDDATANDTNDAAANDTAANDNNDNAESNENKAEDNADDQKNDENQDDNKEEDNQDNNEEENNDENNDDNDFTINDDENNDENNDDNNNSTSYDNGEEESKIDPDSLKNKDRELFDSLSIAEQQIKIKELKKQFGDLYSNTVSLIDRFNEISIEVGSDSIQINKIIKILLDLKSMISFYILNIYDIKSFFENDIAFNRYLVIFNGIKKAMTAIKNDDFSDD